jgi:hypothetical protein
MNRSHPPDEGWGPVPRLSRVPSPKRIHLAYTARVYLSAVFTKSLILLVELTRIERATS